jgi:glutathione peroxidase
MIKPGQLALRRTLAVMKNNNELLLSKNNPTKSISVCLKNKNTVMIKLLIMSTALLAFAINTKAENTQPLKTDTSVYDFKVEGLNGDTINLASFKGKKIMIVNTASYCGNTHQYADLETLYEKYKDKLVIIGFPANNFGAQEPGSNTEIKEFCKKNYGVTFPMAAKVSVKGDDIHPLFKYLVSEAAKIGVNDPIQWNFTKFLLDENGKLIAVIHNKKSVLSDDVTSKL